MLVLGRKEGQSVVIRIPPSNTTRVVEVVVTNRQKLHDGLTVKLGFKAARDIEIVRKEIDVESPTSSSR